MPTVTLERINENIREMRNELKELKNSFHRDILKFKLELEEKGWVTLAEESLKEVWDNEKDAKVWQKYL